MPRRDDEYMADQRRLIAQAALDVLLEKGVYAMSLKDVSNKAGISIGALYTHFESKDELILAACRIDVENWIGEPLPETWTEYVTEDMMAGLTQDGSKQRKRFRLSLQIVAEMSFSDTQPQGLPPLFQIYNERVAERLANLAKKGCVSLPLGIEKTAEIHAQLAAGLFYRLTADTDINRDLAVSACHEALALTAGRCN